MKTKNMVGMGMFSAIVVVLQLFASGIRLGPFSISLVLVPIVVGAALYGWRGGAWLGLVFGVTVLLSGDAAAFMAVNVPGTVAVVLLKGTCSGLLAGLSYRLLESRSRTAAVIAAAVVCPLVNTGIFLLGCQVFFLDTVAQWGAALGYENAAAYLFLGMAGGNFLLELGIDLVLSPVIVRLIRIGKR